MAQYGTNNLQGGSPQTLTATAKSILGLAAATATLRRAFITEFKMGAAQIPALQDCEIVWDLVRVSTAFNGATAVTPSPLDSVDAAAGTVASANPTGAEPTTGASLDVIALNQRNSQQWIARDDKSRLVIPATNLAGIVMRAKSTNYANIVLASMKFDE